LADEAAPIFYRDADGGFADFESGLLIAVCGGGEDIDLVEFAFGKVDGLAFCYDGVGLSCGGWR